jgi:hypothetical protein
MNEKKPVVFHKGDFYLREEHDKAGWSGPIFENDGSTEMYYHELSSIIAALKIIEAVGISNFSRQFSDVKRELVYLKYCLEKHPLPNSSYTIGDVEMCACYN